MLATISQQILGQYKKKLTMPATIFQQILRPYQKLTMPATMSQQILGPYKKTDHASYNISTDIRVI